MSKRTNSGVSNGSSKDSTVGEASIRPFEYVSLLTPIAEDKQKKLLQEDSGHFSMIKMLHLADLITELNGMDVLVSICFNEFILMSLD